MEYNFSQRTSSHQHKDHLTSKLKCRRFLSYLLCTLLLFPFHLLPSPVHPTGFTFRVFPGFLVIFTLSSSNNNNNNRQVFTCVSVNKKLHYYLIKINVLIEMPHIQLIYQSKCLIFTDTHITLIFTHNFPQIKMNTETI